LLLFVGAHSVASGVQVPARPIRVAVGFGVDTARSPQREIFALYRSYLAHLPDSLRPNPLWSEAEQKQWPGFDLLSGYVFQGFTNFTVVHLAPAVGLDSTYLIRTLISSVHDSGHEVKPLALYRVYATREAGQWVLANALPRLTRTWRHETIRRVSFVHPPAIPFDRRRAETSAAFVDSLAYAFELPPPSAIDYYFTDDLIETFGAMGLDFFPLGSDTVGGRSNPLDRLVFIGSSSNGEGYRHELAHVVLAPLSVGGRTSGLVMEGLMTWTGGSAGLAFADLLPGLRAYLQAHPQLTLEAVMTHPPPREGTLDVGYDGVAVLCAMVYDKGGLAAIRELTNAGLQPTDALTAAGRLLGVSRDDLDRLWRDRVLAY
jgi:hypothetical protein